MRTSAVLGDHEPGDRVGDRRTPASANQYAVVQDARGQYNFRTFEDENEEGGLDVARYWRMLLKHRWVVIGCFIGALAVGLALTLLMTPIFDAQTTLKIDRESARIVDVEGVEPREQMGANEEFFQTQYGLLKSRTLATNVVDRLGFASSDTFFKSMGVAVPKTGPGSSLTERRRQAVELFQKNLRVAPVRGSRLVQVSFSSPDPALAANVANTTANEFIASNLNRRYESSSYAREFLEARLAETKGKLEVSERQVADYATREGIINVAPQMDDSSATGTQSLSVTSLVALNGELVKARGERIKAEERWRQAQTSPIRTLSEVLQNPTVQELSQIKAKLSGDYQQGLQELQPAHPKMIQLKAQLDEADRQLQAEVQNVQRSLNGQYQIALAQEKSFETQVQKLQGMTLDMGQRSIQYGILQREADTNRTLYDGLLQRYKEIGVAGGIATNNIAIVDRAEVPDSPSKPKPLINMALAGLFGLALGVILALLFELLDESIASPEDMEGKLGLPLLGSVPKLGKGQNPAEALADPRSAFSEAYYSIRTALQFSTAQGAPSSILITSSRPSEGKSTTALAIAKNFARVGIRVLLVDGDLRNPSMHRNMGADNSQGLSNVLTGALSIEQAAQPTDSPHLSFIPCGPLPPNPAELLAGDGWREFLDDALKIYSIVVVDGPPVLGLADAPTLAASIGGTVFVVESRGTRRGLGRTAIKRLQLGHARLLGGVLTKFDAKRSSYGYGAGYAYAYDYNYGSKPPLPGKD